MIPPGMVDYFWLRFTCTLVPCSYFCNWVMHLSFVVLIAHALIPAQPAIVNLYFKWCLSYLSRLRFIWYASIVRHRYVAISIVRILCLVWHMGD